MVELNDVIKEWNTRWRHKERLRIEEKNNNGNIYAQIGFSFPSISEHRSHYEFYQEGERFSVCFHKEDFNGRADTSYQKFTVFVRGLETKILKALGEIIPNIDRDDFTLNENKKKYFWLHVHLPATATAKQACDCMERLISATYKSFSEQLDEQYMQEFDDMPKIIDTTDKTSVTNGTGAWTNVVQIIAIDDASAEYLRKKASATKKTPTELVSEMIQKEIAATP